MLEVELKFRAADREAVIARAVALGAEFAGEHREADTYLNAPDRDFRKTDEAFRIRRTGDETRLTYKGPRRDAETKTRTEIEVLVGEGRDATAELTPLFVALGYKPVAVVRKRRTVYRLERPVGAGMRPVELCFDDVTGVGSFVELEIQAEEAAAGDYAAAKAAVLALAADLGLSDPEQRSYLGLLLESGSGA